MSARVRLTGVELKDSIEKIIEIFLDNGVSFTPYTITQFLRETGKHVAHSDVREYLTEVDQNGWEDFDYCVSRSYVNGSTARSRVYHLETNDIEDDIEIKLEDLQAFLDKFLDWDREPKASINIAGTMSSNYWTPSNTSTSASTGTSWNPSRDNWKNQKRDSDGKFVG